VQAKGFLVDGLAQVAINLLDIDITAPADVFGAVQTEAAAHGISIAKSEIVGLAPERALYDAAAHALKLVDAPEAHSLEARIRAGMGPPLDLWLDQLAGAAPTPGGGSAAALAGALGASLVAMVSRLTVGRKAYATVEAEFREITDRADSLRMELRRLVEDDAAAYDRVGAAYKLPKDRPSRQETIDAALLEAARIPCRVARLATDVAGLARRAAEAGNQNAASDAAVAAALALASCRGGAHNVEINIAALSQPRRGSELLSEALEYVRRTEALAREADQVARGRIKPGR